MSASKISQIISDSIALKQRLLEDESIIASLGKACDQLTDLFKKEGKLLICGNGGSAADAQHIAAELSGKYLFDRDPLFAEALTVNSSYITAVANDYSYQDVFSRMVKAKGKAGDVLLCISTSGNSENVVKAAEMAKTLGITVISMTGKDGAALKPLSDILINVPGTETPRVQECHILIGHILCELVEERLFERN